jgi:hypothetical protein
LDALFVSRHVGGKEFSPPSKWAKGKNKRYLLKSAGVGLGWMALKRCHHPSPLLSSLTRLHSWGMCSKCFWNFCLAHWMVWTDLKGKYLTVHPAKSWSGGSRVKP